MTNNKFKTISLDEIYRAEAVIAKEIAVIELAIKELQNKRRSYLTHTQDCLKWVEKQLKAHYSRLDELKLKKEANKKKKNNFKS